MFNALEPWHIIVLVVVLIALFGAKRLPDAARGLGTSLRVFKSEARQLRDDDHDEADATGTGLAQPAASTVAADEAFSAQRNGAARHSAGH